MNNISTYIKDPMRIGYGLLKRIAPLIKDDETYIRLLYFFRMHKILNINSPETFTEKIQWLKLYCHKKEYTKLVDKFEVKKYVANIIGEEYMIPTIGVWDRAEDIDWENLPNKFVLKTTHGGGSVGVVLCKDKNSFNKKQTIKYLNNSLKQDIYIELREWPYKNVKKQIIAEPLLEDQNTDFKDISDYKFYCFNGDPKYCQVIRGRYSNETIDFFDMEWNRQEFIGLNPKAVPSTRIIQKPTKYIIMQDIARKLSKDMAFSRIDLYEINGKVYFGEITFYPASGMGVFKPKEWNKRLGDMLDLNRCQIS